MSDWPAWHWHTWVTPKFLGDAQVPARRAILPVSVWRRDAGDAMSDRAWILCGTFAFFMALMLLSIVTR